jgi:peptidyl-tRNA hydrolase, PTH1 family
VYLIAGLGNPGPRYKDTRHNIGFNVINLWAEDLDVQLTGKRFQSVNILTRFEGEKIFLVRPLTHMNRSGESIRSGVDYYGVQPEKLLVVHDDLDLPVGRIRVVKNGGDGGHKGIMSLIHHLGIDGFARVRVGIGRPRYMEPVEDFVLKPFYKEERQIVGQVIRMAVQACEIFVGKGVESAMNIINGQNLRMKEVTG